jgi:exopolysaccharide biosynthesis protein
MKKIFYILLISFLIFTTDVFCKSKIIKSNSSKPKASNSKKIKIKDNKYFVLTVKDSLLADGIEYKNLFFGNGKMKFSAHVVEADLTNKSVDIGVFKAFDQTSELAKLQQILYFHNQMNPNNIVAGVNANFWKAYSNNPIGPLVIEGHVIEMNLFRAWSGFFLDKNNHAYIEQFKLSGKIRYKNGKEFYLTHVNRRTDSTDIVFYNKYGGEVIPYVRSKTIDQMINQAMIEQAILETFSDSTENDFNLNLFKEQLMAEERTRNLENSFMKAEIKYLDTVAVNRQVKCLVTKIGTGAFKTSDSNAVISFGTMFFNELLPNIGDTITFNFETNLHSDIEFYNCVTGTPRIVRDGKAVNEAVIEGNHGKRFINRGLSRTAIGIDEDNTKFYLVTIDHENKYKGKKGANLAEFGNIMKLIGCYDAINLDGGGSSIMVIDYKNVMAPEMPEASRKINAAIGVISCGKK